MNPPPPIRIRIRPMDDGALLQLLMPHPMETGWRRDVDGQPVPAHHITQVQVALDGQPLFQARFGIAVAADPLLTLVLPPTRSGQLLQVGWTDNQGQSRSDALRLP